MRVAKVAILVVCLLAGAGAFPAGVRPAYAAGANRVAGKGQNKNEAEGRRHARKANQLADVNKCKAAIPEYTKALRLLKDPTLLFNRGECYRRTGEATKAIADYRKFLAQLPSAPNRGQVESQIAALDKKSPATRAAVVAAPSPPIARAPVPKPAPPTPTPTAPPTPTSEPEPSTPSAVEEHRPVEPLVAEEEAVPAAPSLPRAPEPVETPGPMALATRTSPGTTAADSSSGSSHWWIWVLGAVVIAGAGAGTYFALKQGATDVPPSALGNYKF